MSYAIRFLPIDPSDPSPALYLSEDSSKVTTDCRARVTSMPVDLDVYATHRTAQRVRDEDDVQARCAAERLTAAVVPLAEALADLETT